MATISLIAALALTAFYIYAARESSLRKLIHHYSFACIYMAAASAFVMIAGNDPLFTASDSRWLVYTLLVALFALFGIAIVRQAIDAEG